MNIEREKTDMDEKIDELESVYESISDIIKKEYTDVIHEVITEWNDYTRQCMEEALSRIEELEAIIE